MGGYKLNFKHSDQQEAVCRTFPGGRNRHAEVFTKNYRLRTSNESLEAPELEYFPTNTENVGPYSDCIPARHSAAGCTDLALRRELRKKFANAQHCNQPPSSGEAAPTTLNMRQSFLRAALEKEDRVESLALWEESECDRYHKKVPFSWHGESVTNSSGKKLENFLRKKKSFQGLFNGMVKGLGLSSSRKAAARKG